MTSEAISIFLRARGVRVRCACEACARVWVSVLVCCVRARVRVRVQRPPVAIVDLAFFNAPPLSYYKSQAGVALRLPVRFLLMTAKQVDRRWTGNIGN